MCYPYEKNSSSTALEYAGISRTVNALVPGVISLWTPIKSMCLDLLQVSELESQENKGKGQWRDKLKSFLRDSEL